MLDLKFVLVAGGQITAPGLTIVLKSQEGLEAVSEATKIAKQITAAGYQRFTVFKIDTDHVVVADFRTSPVEPEIIVLK